jgi:hypothetical protein
MEEQKDKGKRTYRLVSLVEEKTGKLVEQLSRDERRTVSDYLRGVIEEEVARKLKGGE